MRRPTTTLPRAVVSADGLRRRRFAGSSAAGLSGAACVVDALLGTGARGNPRPPHDAVIRLINEQSAPVVAVDLPSGLDCDSGRAGLPTVRADVTCTFVAEKQGFHMAGRTNSPEKSAS
ncbi:MAG: NAD(P)H-hydrate epimerase [Pirellulales bacterium]